MRSVKGCNGNGVGVELSDVRVCVNRYVQQVQGVVDGSGPSAHVLRRRDFAVAHTLHSAQD
jgi:hypothetical protein